MARDDAWSFYESLTDQDRRDLTEVQREVAAICDLRQEVSSGGLDAYLRYGGGDSAPEALAALPKVLGPAWAELLHTAMSLLGPEYPTDADARSARMENRDLDDALDALDARYFELEGSSDADARVSSYLAGGDG